MPSRWFTQVSPVCMYRVCMCVYVCVYEGKKEKKRGLEAAGVKFRPLPSVYKIKVVFSVSVVLSSGVQVQVESVLKMFSNCLKMSCESP